MSSEKEVEVLEVHNYCDICGVELTEIEIKKARENENYEFPFCDNCFKDTVEKIKYFLEK